MLTKTKILSFFSISLVVVLLALGTYQLFTQVTNRTKVETSIHRTELKYSLIVKFVINNNEERGLNYTFYFYINDKLERTRTAFLPKGRKLSFIANLNTTRTKVTVVRFVTYKTGDPEPVSDIINYVG